MICSYKEKKADLPTGDTVLLFYKHLFSKSNLIVLLAQLILQALYSHSSAWFLNLFVTSRCSSFRYLSIQDKLLNSCPESMSCAYNKREENITGVKADPFLVFCSLFHYNWIK